MVPLLVCLLAAVLVFIVYWTLTSKSRSTSLSPAPDPRPRTSASSSSVANGADEEDEATRVRVAGPRLVRLMGGLKTGDEIPIADEVTIGRGQSSTVRLHDPEMSAVHAGFHIDKGQPFVVDLGSTNGTFVNGAKVDPNVAVALKDGDQIKLGMTNLMFKDGK